MKKHMQTTGLRFGVISAIFFLHVCSITDNYDEIPSQVTNPVTKEVLDKCFALDVGQLQIDVGLLEGK